jgi:serine/threonine protein kinase
MWSTPTTKANAIAGIALGMKFAHRQGIVHGSLNPHNILFDEDHCIHTVVFCSASLSIKSKETNEIYENEGDENLDDPKRADVFSFSSVMYDSSIDRSRFSQSLVFNEEGNRMTNKREFPMVRKFFPRFVWKMIANGLSESRYERYSFEKIVETMKKRCFLFTEGVDVSETLELVVTVEESSV